LNILPRDIRPTETINGAKRYMKGHSYVDSPFVDPNAIDLMIPP